MIAPVLATELKYFLTDYLPRQKNASRLTIVTYRDALKLFLVHVARVRETSIDKLTFAELDRTAVLQFLDAIERERHNAVTTRNARLTGIRSFFRSVATRHPAHLEGAPLSYVGRYRRAAAPVPRGARGRPRCAGSGVH